MQRSLSSHGWAKSHLREIAKVDATPHMAMTAEIRSQSLLYGRSRPSRRNRRTTDTLAQQWPTTNRILLIYMPCRKWKSQHSVDWSIRSRQERDGASKSLSYRTPFLPL